MLTLLTTSILPIAFADPLNEQKGFYFSANAGAAGIVGYDRSATTFEYSNEKWSYKDFQTNKYIGFSGIGVNIYGGYRFNKNLALEAGVIGQTNGLVSLTTLSLAAKGLIPIGQRLSLFGKVGGSYNYATFCLFGCARAQLGGVFVGAGADYALSKRFSTTLEINGPVLYEKSPESKSVDYFGLLTLGLTYHFI